MIEKFDSEKSTKMNYYQITADIEDFGDEEEDDDPNWLLTTSSFNNVALSSASRRQTPAAAAPTSPVSATTKNESGVLSNAVRTRTRPAMSTLDEWESVSTCQSGSVNGKEHLSPGGAATARPNCGPHQEPVNCLQETKVVVMRRPKVGSGGGGQVQSQKENANRTSFYRLSRLIEGVASYVSTRTLPEEDGSFHGGEQNGATRETSHSNGHDESPSSSSTDSGFASCQTHDVDPIDAKITEMFESIESVPVPETVSEMVPVVRRRRPVQNSEPDPAKSGSGFFQRRKQTVSGYFSDWAKWITNVETDADYYPG